VALDNELDAQKKEIQAADPAAKSETAKLCLDVPGMSRHLDVEF